MHRNTRSGPAGRYPHRDSLSTGGRFAPLGEPCESTGTTAQEDCRRILKFLRMMNAGDDDASLVAFAIARNWMDGAGAPTDDGLRLVQGLKDMDEVREATTPAAGQP